jgi:pyridoxal/pyridoxine/pyridoxamine kinase
MIEMDGLSIDEVVEQISNSNPDVIVWVDPFVGRNKSVIWTPNWMNLETGESQMLDPCDEMADAFFALYKTFDDKEHDDQ